MTHYKITIFKIAVFAYELKLLTQLYAENVTNREDAAPVLINIQVKSL